MSNGRPDFRASIGNINARFRYYDIDLSTVRNEERVGIAGSFIWTPVVPFDSASVKSITLATGFCFVRFGSPNADHIYLDSGKTFNLVPFDEIFLTNPAQAGKMLRVYYSNNEQISPFLTETAITITDIKIDLFTTGVSFAAAALINGVVTLVTPATNVSGLQLRTASSSMLNGGQQTQLYFATAAPSGVDDITKRSIGAAGFNHDLNVVPLPLLIPAGNGIYCASTVISGSVHIGYDLL